MKKTFLAIAFLSMLLLSCGAPSSEQAAKTSDGGENSTEKTEAMSDDDMKGMDHSKMSDTDKANVSNDIRLVSPKLSEVPMGDTEIVVYIDKEDLKPGDVSVEVMMPMDGEETMTSLAIVEPGDEAQEYKISTNFGMAGPWTVHVMAKDAEPVTLAFNVK